MKGKLIAFASVLCIASLMASGANADKPDNPGDKGDKGKTKTELIVFTGDLQGWAHVEGCCPNAGPYPEYSLTLSDDFVAANTTYFPSGTYDGQVFMNGGKFQFWTEGWPGNHICIEIYGGVEDYDRKAKVLTVTFDEVEWNIMHVDPDKTPIGKVTFDILRVPSRYCTDDICPPSP